MVQTPVNLTIKLFPLLLFCVPGRAPHFFLQFQSCFFFVFRSPHSLLLVNFVISRALCNAVAAIKEKRYYKNLGMEFRWQKTTFDKNVWFEGILSFGVYCRISIRKCHSSAMARSHWIAVLT